MTLLLYKRLFVFFLFYQCGANECPISCGNEEINDGEVELYCRNHSDTVMEDRCCLNTSSTEQSIVGLDMRNCSLEKLNITTENFTSLIILDLQDNPLYLMSKKDFVGLLNLNDLYLPSLYPCPGGDKAWETSLNSSATRECHIQLNPCKYLNVSCTVNGACIHTGPGSAKCTCLTNHHGYKCLEQGEFPTGTFIGSLCVPTIFLSIVLWYTQRRHVRSVDKQD